MNGLFHLFIFTHAYIDELIILTKKPTENLQKIESTVNKLDEKGLKYTIKRSIYGQTEKEYWGFWVTCDGNKPINIKIERITNINQPDSRK